MDRRLDEYLRENAAFRRYVLRELDRRGPLLSREIDDHAPSKREAHRWWGARKMGLMLQILNATRPGRRRRPARQAARLGSRRALVPGDGAHSAGRRRNAADR